MFFILLPTVFVSLLVLLSNYIFYEVKHFVTCIEKVLLLFLVLIYHTVQVFAHGGKSGALAFLLDHELLDWGR